MPGLFDGIADFFFQIFSGDPETLRLRKQLRELQETVLSVSPAVWNKNTHQVQPGLAQSWFQFYRAVLPLFDIFSKTIGSIDRKIEALSLQYLVESLLVGEIADRRLALSYDQLKVRFQETGNADSAVTALNLEFSNLLGDIRLQNIAGVDHEIHELFRFKNVVTFSFHSFFKKFGYDLEKIGKENPRFVPVDGDNLLPDLLDLYYLIGELEVSPALQRGIVILLERLGGAEASKNIRVLEKILDRLRDLLRGPCSPYLTLSLIRLLRQEPEVSPEVWKPKNSPVQEYLDSISDRFTRDRDRLLREFSESTLKNDIQVLFPTGHLLELENYSETTSKELQNIGLAGLDRVLPLALLKSFTVSVLEGGYLDSVKQVVVNGFFQDKEYASKLNTTVLNLEKVSAHLEAFDRSLRSEGKTTLDALEKYLASKAGAMTVPNQILDKINRQAAALLEEKVNEVAVLTMRTSEILQDYKSPQPQFVSNIKGLGGKNNREILTSLISGYNKSLQFLKIMKNFVVIRGLKIS
ncbi:MAG: hypothetical protein HKM06_08890 [Spirochaetales bacterium]|nr:hypothetical protein [Spirochaetales bacterium]